MKRKMDVWQAISFAILALYALFLILPLFRLLRMLGKAGFFLGFDMLYSHYNIGSISLPLELYPILKDHRLQGDFYGIGLSAGGAFWLSDHWSVEMSAGALAGYKKAGKYECAWCGSRVGTAEGLVWVPKLDVSIAYHIFSKKRNNKYQY